MSVAAEFRAEMARQHVPQHKIAAVLGMSQQAVSRRLRGDIALDTDEIEKLAAALDLAPLVILERAA